MVLLSIFFTRSDPRRDHRQIVSLFILSLHALALHLAVKILLPKSFLYEDLEHVVPIHLSVVFPSRIPAGPHFVTQPILLSENIPNIWHKSSTKHKEGSDQIETIKTIMQTTRPRITWKVLPMAQVAILKKYSIKCEKGFRLWIVLFWTKRHNVSHYISLATDNIHIIV